MFLGTPVSFARARARLSSMSRIASHSSLITASSAERPACWGCGSAPSTSGDPRPWPATGPPSVTSWGTSWRPGAPSTSRRACCGWCAWRGPRPAGRTRRSGPGCGCFARRWAGRTPNGYWTITGWRGCVARPSPTSEGTPRSRRSAPSSRTPHIGRPRPLTGVTAHSTVALGCAGPNRCCLLVRLAADSGARRGELAALQFTDLDGDVLTIARGTSNEIVGPTKTSSTRRLTLGATTATLWRDTVRRWQQRLAGNRSGRGYPDDHHATRLTTSALGTGSPPWLLRPATPRSPCTACGTPWPPLSKCAELHRTHHSARLVIGLPQGVWAWVCRARGLVLCCDTPADLGCDRFGCVDCHDEASDFVAFAATLWRRTLRGL